MLLHSFQDITYSLHQRHALCENKFCPRTYLKHRFPMTSYLIVCISHMTNTLKQCNSHYNVLNVHIFLI